MNLKSPVVLTNSKKENFSSDISVNSKLPTFNFLQKKSSRKTSSSSQAGNLRCDICLEYERYSQQELIECYECNAKFHKKCYDIENLNDEVKPKCGNFVCNRCEHASKLKMDYTSFQCQICGSPEGILNNLAGKGEFYHIRCLRFIPEVFSGEVPLFKFKHSRIGIKDSIRKWRERTQCKVCKKKEKGKFVIKCANTKCKSFYHIPCAISKNLLLSIDFLYDFYGFNSSMNNFKSIPFYCSCHNRDLINAYNAFTTQIDQVLEEIDPQKVADRHDHRGEYYHEAKKDNNLPVPIPIFPCENCNKISNLTHPEFNFTTKLTSHEDKVNENTDKEVFPTNKFFYDQDESFNLVLGTFPNEYNFNLNDNLSHLNFENLDQIQTKDNYEDVSEPFYNFFKKDMDKYQRTGKTDLTSSDLKELKEFFVNVLKVYKNFDTDFETFYEDIKDHLK